ncbi:MAG: CopG family transcriptional regulator [Planctomycetes bacterium]|jgi:hypothetical protein|nr:CopG family transcriptional regulator [Planctomycetota bacterium]
MKKTKQEIITFKVDEALLEALTGIPNRSEFIRTAILNALDSACPLCNGTGVLTPNQRDHWATFSADHSVEKCGDCHEFRLVCARQSRRRARNKATGRKDAQASNR